MKKKNSVKQKKNIFYKILGVLLVILSIIFMGVLFYINLLPLKYTISILVCIGIFDLINILLLNHKRLKKKVKKILIVIVFFVIMLLSIGSIYIYRTLDVLVSNGETKYKLEHYSVIALKSSDLSNLDDIKNKTIGYYQNSSGSELANKHLNKKVKLNFDTYKSADVLVKDLLNSEIDVILIEDSIKTIMSEELPSFSTSIKVLYTFTIKIESESTLKDVNVTENSFAIYISGIDTYGEISSVSRSDVNILLVANPTTKQILLISIPRDYYVQLHNTTGVKDKLTHAGIYGINMSIKTLEDLLDVEINYYIKVNFTSVIDIVDALGGLDVYSDYSFISYSGYSFKKGYNSVSGEQALDFVRTRKAFIDGDRQRGKNQQALIEALIRKASNKSIITKYNSLLNAINGKYQTNMGVQKITSLIRMQLNDMSPWNITSYSLTGTDSSNYTYTYNQLLYVMEPNKNSVDEAISLIDEVLSGEVLDSSYGEVTGNSNKVTQIKIPNNTVNESESLEPESEDFNNNKEDSNELKKDETEDAENNDIVDKDQDDNIKEDNIDTDQNDNPESNDQIKDNEDKEVPKIDDLEDVEESSDPLKPIIPQN